EQLTQGLAPIMEPGLNELLSEGVAAGLLRFTTDTVSAAKGASVVWITFDTPVSEDDQADVAFVTSRIAALSANLDAETLVIISSQLPVGSVRDLEQRTDRQDITFAALPENL